MKPSLSRAWVEAIRASLRTAPPGIVEKALQPYAAVLARLVPEVTERLKEASSLPALSPDEERLRLFEALAGFFMGIAREQPLALFVLVYNLGNLLRRLGLPQAIKDWSPRSVQVKLIKIGGRLVRHARRLVFQLAEAAVPRALFQGVLDRIGRLCPAPG
jgi:hypothetical protein